VKQEVSCGQSVGFEEWRARSLEVGFWFRMESFFGFRCRKMRGFFAVEIPDLGTLKGCDEFVGYWLVSTVLVIKTMAYVQRFKFFLLSIVTFEAVFEAILEVISEVIYGIIFDFDNWRGSS
jgi:hypothetical protein